MKATLQNQLTHVLSKCRRDKIMQPTDDNHNPINNLPRESKKAILITWHTSVKQQGAGDFLKVIPRSDGRFAFHNEHFRNALRLRYLYPVYGHMPSMKCICTIQQNFPQGNIVEHRGTVDRCGHHLLTGCSTTNSRIEIHNTIVRELNSILRYCGLRTKEEEIIAFNHPVTGESISAHRPDISVLNPSFYTTKKKLVLDIAITTPLVGVQGGTTVSALGNSVKVMKEPFKNGKNKYNQKIAKYENEILQHILPIDPNAIHVLPIVMETTGAIHPEFDKFL